MTTGRLPIRGLLDTMKIARPNPFDTAAGGLFIPAAVLCEAIEAHLAAEVVGMLVVHGGIVAAIRIDFLAADRIGLFLFEMQFHANTPSRTRGRAVKDGL